MNDDYKKIVEMIAAINTRLEINERSAKQIDQQLSLLNLKREAELATLRSILQALTETIADLKSELAARAEDDMLTLRMTLQNSTAVIAELKTQIAAKSETDKGIDELKNAIRQSVKSDDLLTLRMALQNTSIGVNDVKKRVDGLKFESTKRFNEINVNGEINHKAVMKAVDELRDEISRLGVKDIQTGETGTGFEVSSWWSGDKNSEPKE